MATIKTIAEINKSTFIKHYNNPELDNEQLCKKLQTTWAIIARIAKSSKAISEQLTMFRSRANNQSVYRPLDAAEIAAAAPAATVASSNGGITIKLLIRNDNNQVVLNKDVSAENGEGLTGELRSLLREHRITKVDFYRAGEFVNVSDFRDGDEIVARAKLEAASK